MPEAEITARGGAEKWRTVKTSDGRTIRIAVVRKAGPRGGRTVAGPIHQDPKRGEKKKQEKR